MYSKGDPFLKKWREDISSLQDQVARLSGNPPKTEAAIIAVLEGQISELKRLIKNREERLAERS